MNATEVFTKEILQAGKPARLRCLEIDGRTYCLSDGVVTTARLEDEWFEDVARPGDVVDALRRCSACPDIFTFWQRPPDDTPRFAYYREIEAVAVLPILGFDHWWNKQIKPATRNLVRKAAVKGVEVREAAYDDDFVRGMTEIFNETPIRQGRRFWHYGKDFESVKSQFSRYLFRETLIGAYHEGRLIGFVMLGNAGAYGTVGQIISKMAHREKSPNNALLAEAVRICERQRLPHLVYASWADGTLGDFKRHNGFAPMKLPRYWLPLTRKGQLVLSLRLHHGWKRLLPEAARDRLKRLRARALSLGTRPRATSAT